jgi:DnaJ-domain-containing protein 1
MRYYGKILGGLLGFALMRHPFGLLLGALLGHALDAGWLRRAGPGGSSPDAPDNPLDQAYATLEVSPSASDEEIDLAYRRQMTRYHPDKAAGAPEDIRALAEERARAINAAYDRIVKARRRG